MHKSNPVQIKISKSKILETNLYLVIAIFKIFSIQSFFRIFYKFKYNKFENKNYQIIIKNYLYINQIIDKFLDVLTFFALFFDFPFFYFILLSDLLRLLLFPLLFYIAEF